MKVSWDDDIPNMWKNRIHVPNHQPVYIGHKGLIMDTSINSCTDILKLITIDHIDYTCI